MLGFLFNNSSNKPPSADAAASERAPAADPRRKWARRIVFAKAPSGTLSTLDGTLLWRVTLWDISREGMSVVIKQAGKPVDTDETYLVLELNQYSGSESLSLKVSKVSFTHHGGNYYVGLQFNRSRLPKNTFLDTYFPGT